MTAFLKKTGPALCIFLLPFWAKATNDIPLYRADPVTVTATPLINFGNWMASESIYTEEIEQSQQNNLPGLLRYQLGTPMLSTGGLGQSTSLFLRGAEARHTLFLVEGVPIGSATTGLSAIERFPASIFGEVNVFKGNMSAVYGSGALGGVIDATLRKHEGDPKFSATSGFGNQKNYRITTQYGGKINDTQFFIGLNTQGTEGQSAMIDSVQGAVNPDKDSHHNQSATASISQKLSGGSEIGLHLLYIKANTQYDNPYAAITDNQQIKANNHAMIAYWKIPISAVWQSHFSVSETTDKMKDYINGHQTDLFETRNRLFFWRNQLNLADNQTITAGIDLLEQKVASSVNYDQNKRDIKSLYAGYNAGFSRHYVMLNLRYDHYSDVGSATTYLAGYRYAITNQWQVGVTTGNAFTAPSFNLLYYPQFGNPDLKPEKSTNQEISLHYLGKKDHLRITGFRSKIRDLIGGFPIRNFARSEITGIELNYMHFFDPLTLRVNLTAQNPKDKENNDRLNRRTRHHGLIRLDYEKGVWQAGAQWFISGNKVDNGIAIGGYGIVNLNLSRQIHKNWRLGGSIENLFNRVYSELDGYQANNRLFWLQLTYQPVR